MSSTIQGGGGRGELKIHIWKMARDLDSKEAVAVTHFLTLSASLSCSLKTQSPEQKHLIDPVLEQPHVYQQRQGVAGVWFPLREVEPCSHQDAQSKGSSPVGTYSEVGHITQHAPHGSLPASVLSGSSGPSGVSASRSALSPSQAHPEPSSGRLHGALNVHRMKTGRTILLPVPHPPFLQNSPEILMTNAESLDSLPSPTVPILCFWSRAQKLTFLAGSSGGFDNGHGCSLLRTLANSFSTISLKSFLLFPPQTNVFAVAIFLHYWLHYLPVSPSRGKNVSQASLWWWHQGGGGELLSPFCFPCELAAFPETGFCVAALGGTVLGAWKGTATNQPEWMLAVPLAGILFGLLFLPPPPRPTPQQPFSQAPALGRQSDLQALLQDVLQRA